MTTYHDENRFYITGDFNKDMAEGVVPHLRKEIDKQADRANGLIEFYVSSHGGYAFVLIQIVELMELAKRRGVKVRTIVTSHAYSCGSLLAVAGSKGERFISRYAEHLAHYGSFDGYRKTTPLQVERDADAARRWTARILDHYQRYCDIPDLAEQLKDDSFWVPADKAILWGMADKYTEQLR